jgi:hypothetical protein
MGLLDDAIREHLELKRLRGADPGEVARAQREALDPVLRDDDGTEMVSDPAVAKADADVAVDGTAPVRATPPEEWSDPVGHAQSAHGPDFSNVGQETVELDMRAVLDEDHGAPTVNDADAERSVAGGLQIERHDARGHGRAPSDGSSAAVADEQGDGAESAEDVLEETPDFLRDTPEQERLWFEQRPPRDFDFDK